VQPDRRILGPNPPHGGAPANLFHQSLCTVVLVGGSLYQYGTKQEILSERRVRMLGIVPKMDLGIDFGGSAVFAGVVHPHNTLVPAAVDHVVAGAPVDIGFGYCNRVRWYIGYTAVFPRCTYLIRSESMGEERPDVTLGSLGSLCTLGSFAGETVIETDVFFCTASIWSSDILRLLLALEAECR